MSTITRHKRDRTHVADIADAPEQTVKRILKLFYLKNEKEIKKKYYKLH